MPFSCGRGEITQTVACPNVVVEVKSPRLLHALKLRLGGESTQTAACHKVVVEVKAPRLLHALKLW